MMKTNLNIKSFFRGVFGGAIFGVVFVGGLILLIPYDTEILYFWSASMVAVFVLLASISISKQSDRMINEILDRVKRIEERLEGLHKK